MQSKQRKTKQKITEKREERERRYESEKTRQGEKNRISFKTPLADKKYFGGNPELFLSSRQLGLLFSRKMRKKREEEKT